ncbi:zinc finger protein 26 [Bicyclus anynana]|uniref:Zinc finger protein 26 n=1 Tax=Bicyclus anynana TaxID=110368 RepID=A0A6J1PBE9_BICAN|nr:zinc finger protein 26 [Bicyclus anynana]
MSYKDRCRTCLGHEKEMRHVHTTISIAGESVRLSDILLNFYNYTVPEDNTQPDKICINCVHQLTITYSFNILVHSSAKKLSELNIIDSTSDDLDVDYESDDNKPIKQIIKYKTAKPCDIKLQNDFISIFCVECKSEFHSIKQLKEHCTNSHEIKCTIGRDCDYCNEKFDDFRSLVLHRKLHIKPFLCENCWEGFYSVYELTIHSCQPSKNKVKNTTERELKQCDQCGKSYPPGYIKIHMRTHSSDRPYRCKFCPKAFKVPGSLHSHILWNHKRTRNHKCEVCNATFISSSSRSSHIRKNHLKEKKYGCESCSKRFFSKSELQRHCLTHTGVKNFHCHLCDKSYQTRYGLNTHLKSHTQISMKSEHEHLNNYVNI